MPIGPARQDSATTPQSGSLGRGEFIPDFLLLATSGEPITRASLAGRIVVLTFVAPPSRAAGDADDLANGASEILERISGLDAALTRQGAEDVEVMVVILDPTASARDRVQRTLTSQGRSSAGILLAQEPAAEAVQLAARFGVVWWPGATTVPVQSFMVLVIGREGAIVDLFPGVLGWSEHDLLAATLAARER